MQEELPVRSGCKIYFVAPFERKLFDEFFLDAILSKNLTKDLTPFHQNVNVGANIVLGGIEYRAHEIPSLLGCRPNYMGIAMAVDAIPCKEKSTSEPCYVSIIEITVLVSSHGRTASKIIGWVDPLLRVVIERRNARIWINM